MSQPPYGQPPQDQPPYGQPQPGQPQYGQPQPPPYGQPQYGQPAGSNSLSPNAAVAIAYIFSWVGGLIILSMEKQNQFVRFHAMQSILLGAAFTAYWIVVRLIFVDAILLRASLSLWGIV